MHGTAQCKKLLEHILLLQSLFEEARLGITDKNLYVHSSISIMCVKAASVSHLSVIIIIRLKTESAYWTSESHS